MWSFAHCSRVRAGRLFDRRLDALDLRQYLRLVNTPLLGNDTDHGVVLAAEDFIQQVSRLDIDMLLG